MKEQEQNTFLINFGLHLKFTRKRLGFTQEKLAYEANIELRQLGRIERGEINTGILSIKIIAETLKINYKDLLDF